MTAADVHVEFCLQDPVITEAAQEWKDHLQAGLVKAREGIACIGGFKLCVPLHTIDSLLNIVKEYQHCMVDPGVHGWW